MSDTEGTTSPTGKPYNEPAETREDLARQTAEAAQGRAVEANVEAAGGDALVEAAESKLPADETNQRIAEARQSAQDEADRARAEAEGTVVADTTAGDDYDSRTVEALQDEIRSRNDAGAGLNVSGTKDELVGRLRDHDASR